MKMTGTKKVRTIVKVIKNVSKKAFPQILERLFWNVAGLMNNVLYKWEATNPDIAKRQNWYT